MTVHSRMNSAAVALCVAATIAVARADCSLDHFFFAQADNQLYVDKCRIYRHGDPAEGYYPLSWSSIYGCWSVGEPGFSDTTDPAYGFPPEIALVGTQNVDYQIWVELLDITPNFKIRTDDGTWLTQVGQRYNLSDWADHHVHMKYRAYVPADPPPDYPFWVTCRLVDDLGPYAESEPFIVVFNVAAAAVEATEPPYYGTLETLDEAELIFTFHRPIAVTPGEAPVIITDDATQTQDYYAGYFTFDIPSDPPYDGKTLILTQVGGTLPDQSWLRVEFTEHLRDGVEDRPVIPFTQYVFTNAPPAWCRGDMNCSGGTPEFMDINYFVSAIGCESCWWGYYRAHNGGADPPCHWLMGDYPGTPAGVEFQDIVPFANSIGQSCISYR